MVEKRLTINQQLALLPAAVPDSILDFLEDFNYSAALASETVRSAFDPDALAAQQSQWQKALDGLRSDGGSVLQLTVEAAGRDLPGGYLVKMTLEKGEAGLAILTRVKERSIQNISVKFGVYDAEALKAWMKKPE
jgi:hypothetical protein